MLRGLATLEHPTADAEVLVVTSGWPNDDNPVQCVFVQRQMDALAARGVRYETLFIRGYRSPLAYVAGACRLLAWNFTRPQYRLVHCHGGEASLVAWLYRRAPLLNSYLGDDILGKSYRPDAKLTLEKRLRRWITRQHSRMATATITKSAEMERALPRAVQSRNHVVPNGVDTVKFAPRDRDAARAELGWDADARVALFVADPAEVRKRYALSEAGVEAADAKLGNVRLEVAHRVTPDAVPTYMNASDCLVLLSFQEGSPNVVKEALMCNLPVIGTRVGDMAELLKDVEPSYLVEPAVEAVGDALVSCLRTPRRSNGRERSGHLTAEAIADRVLDLYNVLMTARA
jgi:glycosyltransferase involved in cell wall biosynthesis